jgi:lactoylglutathione lyase
MKSNRTSLHKLLLTSVASGALLLGAVSHSTAADPAPEFSRLSIDIGVVVSDIEASAKFYTEVLGFKEVPGFSVLGARGKAIGIIDNLDVDIRVFVLGDGPEASKIKLMSFPKKPGVKPAQDYIHSTIGLSYLTIFVKDMGPSLERLKKAKVKLLGESPVDLGGGTLLTAVQDPDGNFIEIVGPGKK